MKCFATLSCALAAAAALSLSSVVAERVVYDWHLGYKHVNPDGLHQRRVISINDQWPPAPVKLNINDTLVIHVHNKLNEPTVIHAHGINQNNRTNIYDGAGMVTQCPIPPNYDFTYEFPVTQAGTFWIHSHFKVQYMDGLRVPLVVYDSNEPFEYDQDEIITVSDWYHEDSYTNLEQYMNEDNLDGVEPIPQSGLINDHVNATFHFKPGKTYRLRIINVSGIATFGVSIDDHDMQVIEVDGVRTQAKPVRSVYMAAGQRVSVLVKTKNTTDRNYRLHANMAPVMFDYIPDDLQMDIEAPIYYDESKPFAPRDDPSLKKGDYDDAFTPPLIEAPALKVDRQVNFTIDFMENTDGLNHGVINGIPYLTPLVPSLHTLLSVGEYANNSAVYGPQSITHMFELNEVVELVINNLDDGPHPFHLHGHAFQVIARGSGVYSNQTIDIPSNPTYRDTIGVPSEGYIVIRFRADNPGVWFFHCHVDWHLPAGLAATFITAPELAQETMTLPQEWIDMCIAAGQPGTGNAAGKEGLDLDGAPDGVRPIQSTLMMSALIATLVGMSTVIWHVWVDPGADDDEDEDDEQIKMDKKPLLQDQQD
ncbi:Cupredoxin [Mucor lusitanicus]|nr:Cupredoxin [Mucor lusitanicus]